MGGPWAGYYWVYPTVILLYQCEGYICELVEEPRVEIRSYKKEQRNHTDSLNYLHLATREVDIITVGGSNSYVGQKQARTI